MVNDEKTGAMVEKVTNGSNRQREKQCRAGVEMGCFRALGAGEGVNCNAIDNVQDPLR